MEEIIVNLDEEKNREYFLAIDNRNKLMEKWNVLNKKLINLKQPKIALWGHKGKIKSIGLEIRTLQDEYLEWNKSSGDLMLHPNFFFKESEDGNLGFLHYTNILRHLISTMDSKMVMLAENHSKVSEQYSNQVNFNLALISFLLTFLGLLAAIYSIWFQ